MHDITFNDLGLKPELLEALASLEITIPTDIQAKAIPPLLDGKDILAKAQTGSGKTAAFALPIIHRLDAKKAHPQCLILAPTRELSIQVAKACEQFSKHIKGIQVCTLYGGADYKKQLQDLRKGASLIVGTPGRVMDHIRRGTLKLAELKHLVLDEADEMLRMGFLQDVNWILEQVPSDKQMALFSATMPSTIKRLSEDFLNDPAVISIPNSQENTPKIEQKYLLAAMPKRAAIIARLLELRAKQGVIIFTRTKAQTQELELFLRNEGFKAKAINSDLKQSERKRALDSLEASHIDIVVATDVAARGIDIARVSCVINYELPFDNESYVHRIGRTGRAGRSGESIVFVNSREERFLKRLEGMTKSKINRMVMPSAKEVNTYRKAKFCQEVLDVAETLDLSQFDGVLEELKQTLPAEKIAAAVASMLHQRKNFLIDETSDPLQEKSFAKSAKKNEGFAKERDKKRRSDKVFKEGEMARFKIAVGRRHGAKPGNIVGAIANEAGISSQSIGQIDIMNQHSFVYLPSALPKQMFKHLQKARVCGVMLNIHRA